MVRMGSWTAWRIVAMVRTACLIAAVVVLLTSCSDKGPEPIAGDTTPPAAVADFTMHYAGGSSVILSWTAPGDDGTSGQAERYDVRYSHASLVGAGWDSALVVASLPPDPKPAGEVDSATVVDLAPGVWHFALKAADEAPNWSAISNLVSTTVTDTIPPGAVTDLAAVSAGFTSVRLGWTAPGNDGMIGSAAEYDLRRARAPITAETWVEATRMAGVPAPAAPGHLRFLTVAGLEPGTDYCFALRTADDVPNWSALSNGICQSTLSISISRLTIGSRPEGVRRPQWSPDGQSILTDADWDQQYVSQLYLVAVDSGERVRLTHDESPRHSDYPCWSPDGAQIAFSSDRSIDEDEIYTMPATPDAAALQVTHLGIRNLHDCAWSPDGTRIAFAALVGDSPDDLTMTVYVVPAAGGRAAVLPGAHEGQQPAWSPDGAQVAFASDRTGNYEIYVVPAAGGEAVQVTDDPADDMQPAWSPDGRQIAFSSNRVGSYDLWLMSRDGTNPVPITSDPSWELAPSWSPDGTRLAFVRWTSDGIGDIWTIGG